MSDPELEEIPYIEQTEKPCSLPAVVLSVNPLPKRLLAKEELLAKEQEARLDRVPPDEAEELADLPDAPPQYKDDPALAKDWIKDKWWRRIHTCPELIELTGVPHQTLNSWLHGYRKTLSTGEKVYTGGWATERDKVYKKRLSKAIQADTVRIDNLLGKMLSMLEESTQKFIDSNNVLNVEQYSMFIGSFEKLFKTRQLLMGNPTEIYGTGGNQVTWEQVLEKLRKVDIIEYRNLSQAIDVTASSSNGQKSSAVTHSKSDS